MLYPNTKIYCMPIGQTTDELSNNSLSVIEFCKKHNYIFSDRTHIRIYNKRDGV